MPFNRKRQGSGHGRKQFKRKKYNLLTLRQNKDLKEFGELHPVDDNPAAVKKYTKVQDTSRENQDTAISSSDEDSEEEVPVLKQLMLEIGVEEKPPESEEESDSDDGEEQEEDIGTEVDNEEEEEEDDSDAESDHEGEDLAEDGEADSGDTDNNDEDQNSSFNLSEKDEEDSDADRNNLKHSDCEDEKHTDEIGPKEIDEAEDESDEEQEEDDLCLKESDPFTKHFEEEHDIERITEGNSVKWKKSAVKVPGLGASTLMYQDADLLADVNADSDLKKLHVKQKLIDQIGVANAQHCNVNSGALRPQQHKLFQVLNSYQDLLFPKQTFHNTEEIRLVYCLHALNHVLKARSRVMSHNAKMKAKKKAADEDVEYRDQGLTRPKVLILLPYRDRALKVVKMFITLLSSSKVKVSSLKRFESEFSELEKSGLAEKSYKPDDFKKTFEGNTDDNFRVGMSLSKNTLHLYSPFYESDVILASPLGLRAIIGLEGDKSRDFDFLSSIEVLLVDQTDIFLMQNWDHFAHVLKHLHLQPREFHGVDFSRVRMWAINGWSKFYRQTVIFSSVILPEILTVFNKSCHNFAGKVKVHRDTEKGTIQSSLYDSPQFFHRVACDSLDGLSQRQAKFEYLKKKVIPYHTSSGMKQTLIYCSYFSFVMLRNFFREAEIDFLFINEYDSEKHMRNARIHFRKRHPHFMLYTERLHFHYRFRLRGIHHIVWFDLPQYPAFYPELINLMDTSHQACTSTVLFTRFEGQKLMEVVGSKQAAHMMNSEKNVNMITVS
ncbi:digestive organ expansion factor homolog [Aplysia californica]|uniref:U3 small nucleolar RNA-associated protein 25 homolog n=1 Tax=Aplysia californica TaxID=6500 RepID=A0ABM0JWS1_APLCA|nr:digestive organ expansion factor homolog [Aplysia californica]